MYNTKIAAGIYIILLRLMEGGLTFIWSGSALVILNKYRAYFCEYYKCWTIDESILLRLLPVSVPNQAADCKGFNGSIPNILKR